jgi:ParB-like chromosome segregation protein Spo0J
MSNLPQHKIVNTADLIPYARNSRTHSDEQVAQIAASIREFGFLNPIIVDGENGIIAGHGRVLAAQKLKIEQLPCIQANHLTEAQRKAYVIADNKLGLNSGWDDKLLKIELDELSKLGFDLTVTGFHVDELSEIFDEPDFDAGSEEDQGKLDELDPKMCTCPKCGRDFDLREIGM